MNAGTKAVTLCAGEAVRYGGGLKQVADLGGTTTIGRILEATAERGIRTSVVTHKIREYRAAGINADFVQPAAHRWTVETLLNTRDLWGVERTLVLLGDVYYSDALLNLMLKGEALFYCGHAEIWGMSIGRGNYAHVETFLREAVAKAEWWAKKTGHVRHKFGQLWRLYRLWHGLPYMGRWQRSTGLWFQRFAGVEIFHDETTDFDVPREHARWRAGLRGWQVKQPHAKPPCRGLAPVRWGRRGKWRCPYDGKLRKGFARCRHEDCPTRKAY